jgi:hypothetical protein
MPVDALRTGAEIMYAPAGAGPGATDTPPVEVVYPHGRTQEEWERAVIEDATKAARARDASVVAGVSRKVA